MAHHLSVSLDAPDAHPFLHVAAQQDAATQRAALTPAFRAVALVALAFQLSVAALDSRGVQVSRLSAAEDSPVAPASQLSLDAQEDSPDVQVSQPSPDALASPRVQVSLVFPDAQVAPGVQSAPAAHAFPVAPVARVFLQVAAQFVRAAARAAPAAVARSALAGVLWVPVARCRRLRAGDLLSGRGERDARGAPRVAHCRCHS